MLKTTGFLQTSSDSDYESIEVYIDSDTDDLIIKQESDKIVLEQARAAELVDAIKEILKDE